MLAKDALGNDVFVSKWLATHPVGDRTLAQGLKVSMLLRVLYIEADKIIAFWVTVFENHFIS